MKALMSEIVKGIIKEGDKQKLDKLNGPLKNDEIIIYMGDRFKLTNKFPSFMLK